jgi:hypothetical protein
MNAPHPNIEKSDGSSVHKHEQTILQHPTVTSLGEQGFTSHVFHWYRAEDGSPLFARLRMANPATGDKQIRPFHIDNGEVQIGEPDFAKSGYTQGKPLYRLDLLNQFPNAAVYVAEGEKAVDALNLFFQEHGALGTYVATTSGGATSYSKADVMPLANRDVTCWADNDGEGEKYIQGMALRLAGIDCGVMCVDVPSLALPDHGDAVEWLEINPHAAMDDLLALAIQPASGVEILEPLFDTADAAIGDFLNSPPPPRKYLLDNCLLRGKVALLIGMGGVSKSRFAMQLQLAVATGTPLCDEWSIGTTGSSLVSARGSRLCSGDVVDHHGVR